MDKMSLLTAPRGKLQIWAFHNNTSLPLNLDKICGSHPQFWAAGIRHRLYSILLVSIEMTLCICSLLWTIWQFSEVHIGIFNISVWNFTILLSLPMLMWNMNFFFFLAKTIYFCCDHNEQVEPLSCYMGIKELLTFLERYQSSAFSLF